MSKIVQFYNIGIYKNNELTTLNFLKLVDKISIMKWENKVRKINNEILAVFPMFFNDGHKEKRIIPFGKFRLDYKPFAGKLGNPKYNEIKEDVLELVTLVYDSNYRTIAMTFNLYGAKKKLIEEYFSSFLPQTEDNMWQVRMDEVIETFDKNTLKNSEQIKNVEFVLDLSGNKSKFLKKNTTENCILNVLENLGNTSCDYNTNIVKLEFGVNRKSSINKDSLFILLQALNIDSDYIKKVRIRYKNNNSKFEDVDLKNINRILRDTVLNGNTDKNPAPEFLGNSIIDLYANHTGILNESKSKYLSGAKCEKEYPKLCDKPSEINKVG